MASFCVTFGLTSRPTPSSTSLPGADPVRLMLAPQQRKQARLAFPVARWALDHYLRTNKERVFFFGVS